MKLIELNSLKLALELLDLYGLHPQNHTLRGVVMTVLLAMGAVVLTPLVFLDLYLFNDLDNVAASFDTLTSLTQMISKLTCVLYFKKKLSDLIDKVNSFWDQEPFIVDDEYTKEQVKIIEMVSWFFCLFYRNGSIILYAQYAARGIVHRKLPLAGWFPASNPSPLFEIVYLWEMLMIFFIITFVVGFDTLVSALLCKIAIQFRLIAKFITKELKEAEGNELVLKEKFKEFVDYHSFLLKVCDDFEEIFTIIFLCQFLISTATFCLSLYIYSETDLISLRLGSAFYVFQAFLELGCYCFPPTLVGTESENVANAIYEVNWEDWTDKSLKINVISVMEQSQKLITFTAGGWIPLNNNLYVSVLNSAISFYTLMEKKKEE